MLYILQSIISIFIVKYKMVLRFNRAYDDGVRKKLSEIKLIFKKNLQRRQKTNRINNKTRYTPRHQNSGERRRNIRSDLLLTILCELNFFYLYVQYLFSSTYFREFELTVNYIITIVIRYLYIHIYIKKSKSDILHMNNVLRCLLDNSCNLLYKIFASMHH